MFGDETTGESWDDTYERVLRETGSDSQAYYAAEGYNWGGEPDD